MGLISIICRLRRFLSFFLVAFPFLAFSQNSTMEGRITDIRSGEESTDTSSYEIEEVVITSRQKDENITRLVMGVEKLRMDEIKLMPALMGEVDVLKVIQLLPGVQTTSEGSSGFSVRGGSPDQNLILLDNTTVYNPSHMMGFFSIFNNDVISGLELYKGDFPFKFGGRLSSLLDVHSRNETPSTVNGTGGLGLISSRLMLEGPLGEKTTWLVGGRRSYADLFLALAPEKNLRNTTLYFYDMNVKLTHRLPGNDRLELNIYSGSDDFGVSMGKFSYGNTAASLTWSHHFYDNLFAKFSAHYTNYNYNIQSRLENARMNWDSGITDRSLRADFHHPLSRNWNLSYGISSVLHRFKPGIVEMEGIEKNYELPIVYAGEYAAYLSNEQTVTEQLNLRYGLRLSAFQNMGQNQPLYISLEPGINGVFRINENSSVKAGFRHNAQYLQLANNSSAGSPLDIWFPAGNKIKPQKVNLYSAGYFRNLNDNQYETSMEVYYKDLRNVIDFAEHAQLVMNEHLEDDIRTGSGRAYGVEWMIKKNSGKLTGFANYTLSRSERTIPDVNRGKTYPAPFDKTHVINVVAAYRFSKKLNVSATWIFATGNPTTYPAGRFDVLGEYFPVYSGRNEYRRPNYHRLDLSVNYIPRPESKKRWKSEWNFSVYNAYNYKNPWSIYFNRENGTAAPYAEMMYLFGIIPSITYNFKF
ncbi:MAG: TonB-dependent receptor plug domain-containing protein [Dysgonamonadaceae bacterium]|nr:TonB-dependent receptor plug domain-containing protein [Dysgonamonadaceae bacterium]